MNKGNFLMKSILTKLEAILYITLTLFLSLGYVDSLLADFESIELILSGTLGLLFLIFGFLVIYNDEYFYNYRIALLLAALTVFSVHSTISDPELTGIGKSSIITFYYPLVIFFSVLRKKGLYFTILLTISFSIISKTSVSIINDLINSVDIDTYLTFLIQQLKIVGSLWGISLVSFFASLYSRRTIETQLKFSETKIFELENCDEINGDVPPGTNVIQLKPSPKSDVISLDQYSSTEDIKNDELSTVVYFMGQVFPAYSSLGFIYDNTKQAFVLNSIRSKNLSIRPGTVIPYGSGVVGEMAISGVPFISGSLANYSKGLQYYNENIGINSVLAAPIFSPKKELLGALVVDSTDRNVFRENHKAIMERFTYLAAALITNIKMHRIQAKSARHFELLHSATQILSTVDKPQEVLSELTKICLQLFKFSRIITLEFKEEGQIFKIIDVQGNFTEIPKGLTFNLNEGIYSQALTKGQLISISDYDEYRGKYYRFAPNEPDNPNIRSLIVIPIKGNDGYSGMISLESNFPSAFTAQIQQTLGTLANNATIAFQKASLFQKTEKMAKTDGLTQLTNHRTFQELLHHEIMRSARHNHRLSLLLFDIDHFKNFNDTYGHAIGDLVLKEIARTLKETVREHDLPVRYGGEEFCVMAPETDISQAVSLAERIRKAIEDLVIKTDEHSLHVTVSIGCSSLPDHASTKQDLINCADTAMYHSKESGRNRVSIWDKHMKMSE